jgi:hypothetical protein
MYGIKLERPPSYEEVELTKQAMVKSVRARGNLGKESR